MDGTAVARYRWIFESNGFAAASFECTEGLLFSIVDGTARQSAMQQCE